MNAAGLINSNIPQLHPDDSVRKGLQLLNDFRISHLAVVTENKFLGIISEDELLDADEDAEISELQHTFLPHAVSQNIHFMAAVSLAAQFDLSLVPVLNDRNEYAGAIPISDLLRATGKFAGADETGGLIVIETERTHFSPSELSRITESNDCAIVQMNTATDTVSGLLRVTLRLNNREIAPVLAALERFEYNVIHHAGSEEATDSAKSNYEHLMNYLNI